MDRRSFLALLASAPIAALAPWSKLLAARLIDRKTGSAIRFVKEWDIEHWRPVQRFYILGEQSIDAWDV